MTVDRSISFQQNLARYPIALLLLQARTSRLVDLVLLAPALLAALPAAKKGELTQVSG
ncbi:MAG: hypothetical protein WDN08_01495 [Rhizomicrobium sp.]